MDVPDAVSYSNVFSSHAVVRCFCSDSHTEPNQLLGANFGSSTYPTNFSTENAVHQYIALIRGVFFPIVLFPTVGRSFSAVVPLCSSVQCRASLPCTYLVAHRDSTSDNMAKKGVKMNLSDFNGPAGGDLPSGQRSTRSHPAAAHSRPSSMAWAAPFFWARNAVGTAAQWWSTAARRGTRCCGCVRHSRTVRCRRSPFLFCCCCCCCCHAGGRGSATFFAT
jgi:hypothetical protein